jgi:hypothetical protein
MSGSRRDRIVLGPFAILSLLLTPATTEAAGPPPAGATVPSDPVFTALLTDGTTASGRIRQIGPEGNVTLLGDSEQIIPLKRVVKLTKEGPPPTYPPEGTLALFPDGDRLRTVIGPANDTALEARPYVLGEVSIPLDSLLGLVLNPPAEPEALEDLLRKVREEKRSSEVLWLVNGDRLTGGFLGLSPRTISFQPAAEAVEVERAQVVALGFDPSLISYPRPKGEYLELTLADGSRLGVKDARVEKGHLLATTRFGAPIRVSIGELARVHVRGESVAYLSDRPADADEYVAYVGPPRRYRRDSAIDGHPLRLSVQLYDHGLGTQSRTLLAYRLRPGDRRFQATVGIDDRAGPLGSVVFRIRADGEDRFVSPSMSARDTPKEIDVDVSGAKLLILVTEFGERGDIRDFADWAEARLIR